MSDSVFLPPSVTLRRYQSAASQAELMAEEIAAELGRAQQRREKAVIALSGGKTPELMMQALAQQPVDWSRVIVTLVDERWVDESNERSNAAFIRRNLLNRIADRGRPELVSFFTGGVSAEAAPEQLYAMAKSLLPFDIVVLGMGLDGHFASFFPDADNISELLSAKIATPLSFCRSETAREDRVCWSLIPLLACGYLSLQIVGREKLNVLRQAFMPGRIEELPIRAVIHQRNTLLRVFYAPDQPVAH